MELFEDIRTTRIELAGRILRSAARMVKLLEIGAPGVIIENERRIMSGALNSFPVEAEHQLSAERVRLLEQANIDKFLQEHGYYDET